MPLPRCAITFGSTYQFKRNSFNGLGCSSNQYFPGSTCEGVQAPRYVRGKVTTSLLPGSTLIYNRNSSAMELCSAKLCKFAQAVMLQVFVLHAATDAFLICRYCSVSLCVLYVKLYYLVEV